MNENKQLLKKIVNDEILRKHRHDMRDLEHFHRKRNVGYLTITDVKNKDYVEEYGIKWNGGRITCREYPNTKEFLVFVKISYFSDSALMKGKIDGDTVKRLIIGVKASYLRTI